MIHLLRPLGPPLADGLRRAARRAALPVAAALLAGTGLSPATGQAATGAAETSSYPQPALAGDAWQLVMTARNPETIAVRDLAGETRWYWYLPYAVVNQTGEDRLLVPEVSVLTDEGTLIEAGRGVPGNVFSAIEQAVGNPYLVSPEAAVGTLRQGEDFLRESVAIWPVPTEDVDRMTVFFGGLSGETRPAVSPATGEVLTEPVIDPATGQPATDANGEPRRQPVLLRRCEVLEYLTPGTPASPDRLPTILLDRSTVLR